MKRAMWIPGRMFCRIMWPSVASALALAVADIADALVVGNRVGETGLAAIGILTPVYMLYNLIGYGFSTGGCVIHSRLAAAGKDREALGHFRLLTGCILLVSMVIAVGGNLLLGPFLSLLGVNESRPGLFSLCVLYARPLLGACPVFMLNFILYDFVRSDDDPALASLGFSAGCFADLGLNLLLVLGLGMGIKGSIIATVSAQGLSVILLLIHLVNRRGLLNLKDILRAKADRGTARKLVSGSLQTGFSTSIRYLFQFAFLYLANRLLLAAGDRGAVNGSLYVAVFDVVMNVSFVAMALSQAAADTLRPLASAFTQEHDYGSLRAILRMAVFLGCGAGTLLAAAIAVFAGPVSSIFGLGEPAALAVSVPAIRIFCLSVLPAGLLVILTSYFQSTGHARLSRTLTLLRSAIILLPLTLLLGLLLPEYFWWVFAASETLAIAVSLFFEKALGMRTKQDSSPVYTAAMDNANHELARVLEGVEAFCEEQEVPPRKAMLIQLAVEELCVVTMEQAFTGRPDEYIQVTLVLEKNGDAMLLIRNSAERFNPFAMETGRLHRDTKKELLDSIGVLMVKEKTKELHYRNYEGFNVMKVLI